MNNTGRTDLDARISVTYEELAVIKLRRHYQYKWLDRPEGYWLAALMEKVGELAMAVNGEHEHPVDFELRQIASICINWLENIRRNEDE